MNPASTDPQGQARNPFTPNWGLHPRQFVGRERLIVPFREALQIGPDAEAFTTLIIGPRGSGKTVSLQVLEGEAQAMGWHVLAIDAYGKDLEVKIRQKIRDLYATTESLPRLPSDEQTVGGSTGFNLLGLKGRRHKSETRHTSFEGHSLEYHLNNLAMHAFESGGGGVLLTIDELHSGDKEALRKLFGDLQFVIKRNRSPLAFVGAGLPDLRHGLLAGNKSTFLSRCHQYDMDVLTARDAAECLRLTADQAGGTFEPEALRILSGQKQLFPYRVQLLGSQAWKLSGAPEKHITARVAHEASGRADQTWFETVIVPVWQTLSGRCQKTLTAIAARGGTAHPSDIALEVGASANARRRARTRLINIGCLKVLDDGQLLIEGQFEVEDVQRLAPSVVDVDDEPLGAEHPYPNGNKSNGTTPRCGFMMPRLERPCVLPEGHSGRHRSK